VIAEVAGCAGDSGNHHRGRPRVQTNLIRLETNQAKVELAERLFTRLLAELLGSQLACTVVDRAAA
jgi:hypothetical protein